MCHQPGKGTEASWPPPPQGTSTDEMLESPRLAEHRSAGCGAAGSPAPCSACCPARGQRGWADGWCSLLSPWHSNFLAGVVSSSLPSMSGGPAQRAMPGSLYPVLTQLESQRRLQLQYRGLAPMALQEEKRQNCTRCPTEGTGLGDFGTGCNSITWLGCHGMGGPSGPPFLDPPEVPPTVGGLRHTAPHRCPVQPPCCQPHSPRGAPWLCAGAFLRCLHRNPWESLSSTGTKLPGPKANWAKHPEAVQKQDHCTGAAGQARALPHKPTGQGHWSGLLATSSGLWPELVETASGESKELLSEEEGRLLCSTAEQGREQQMTWEAEGLDASLHPPSLQRSAVMEGW